MIYYVDIDETICEYKTERLYKNASPIKNNINKIFIIKIKINHNFLRSV